MDKVTTSGETNAHTKVNGEITTSMVKVSINGQTAEDTMENGRMI